MCQFDISFPQGQLFSAYDGVIAHVPALFHGPLRGDIVVRYFAQLPYSQASNSQVVHHENNSKPTLGKGRVTYH